MEDANLADVIDSKDWESTILALAQTLALEMTHEWMVTLGEWIMGGPDGKPQGVLIRTYVAFWMVMPYLKDLSQTELAQLIGLRHKQSVGREVSDFRDRFKLQNGHMYCDRAREAAQQREAKKHESGIVD